MRVNFYKITNIVLLLFLLFSHGYNSFCGNISANDYNGSEPVNNSSFELGNNNNFHMYDTSFGYGLQGKSISRQQQSFNKLYDVLLNNDVSCYLIKLCVRCTDFFGLTYDKNFYCKLTYDSNFKKFLTGVILRHVFLQSFLRGIFSTKRCDMLNKNTWQRLYLAIGNVPYLGGIFSFSLVYKPSWLDNLHKRYCPSFIKEVTIRIIGFRLFAYLLLQCFGELLKNYSHQINNKGSDWENVSLANFGETDFNFKREMYIYPYVVDLFTIDFKIFVVYNISVNLVSLFISYTFVKQLQKDHKDMSGILSLIGSNEDNKEAKKEE